MHIFFNLALELGDFVDWPSAGPSMAGRSCLLLLCAAAAGAVGGDSDESVAQGRKIGIDWVSPAAGIDPGPHGIAEAGSSFLSKGAFRVRFDVETAMGPGSFVVEINPAWAPAGAERFRQLVNANFFTQNRFFRVIDGFVAQFGISGLPLVTEAVFRGMGEFGGPIVDDPVPSALSNKRGTLVFAMADRPNTRLTQLFFNLRDNDELNTSFPPIGRVVSGMEALDALSVTGEGYPAGPGPMQKRIRVEGNEYLENEFPELSYIRAVTMVPMPVSDGAQVHGGGELRPPSPAPAFLSPPPFAKPAGAFYHDLLRGQPGLQSAPAPMQVAEPAVVDRGASPTRVTAGSKSSLPVESQTVESQTSRSRPSQQGGGAGAEGAVRDWGGRPTFEDLPAVRRVPKLSVQYPQPVPTTRAAASRGATASAVDVKELDSKLDQRGVNPHVPPTHLSMWLLPKKQDVVEEMWKEHYDEKDEQDGMTGRDLYKALPRMANAPPFPPNPPPVPPSAPFSMKDACDGKPGRQFCPGFAEAEEQAAAGQTMGAGGYAIGSGLGAAAGVSVVGVLVLGAGLVGCVRQRYRPKARRSALPARRTRLALRQAARDEPAPSLREGVDCLYKTSS